MAERPRTIWIGTDTPFTLAEYKNEKNGQLITDVTNGTLKLYNHLNALFTTIALVESSTTPGDYEVTVPFDQSGLSEGMQGRMQFEISGGIELNFRLDARFVARVQRDDGL